MSMALKEDELQAIGQYVQSHLSEWISLQKRESDRVVYPLELLERMIRVEEELKNQRELMKLGFEQVNGQFKQAAGQIKQLENQIAGIQTKMFQFMIWSFGSTVTIAGIVIGILKFIQ